MLFWPSDRMKIIFGRGSVPDPAGGAYDAPHTHQSAEHGEVLCHPPLPASLRRLFLVLLTT